MRYALIDPANIVQNVIVWDGVSEYPIPEGWRLVQSEDASIGDDFENQVVRNADVPA